MPKFFRKNISSKSGLPPGALVHVGEKRTEKVTISLIEYDENNLVEKSDLQELEPALPEKGSSLNAWINVNGVHRIDILEKIGAYYDIHPLTLEDIANTHQRSKVEDYGHYLFIVSRMLDYDNENNEVRSEQMTIILGEGFLISFQEFEGDVFDGVRERIRKNRGRIRKSGCDYLAYALLDAIVDHYFVLLGALGDRIEDLEEELLDEATAETSRNIHQMKREMIYLKKQVWPLREVLTALQKGGSELVRESTSVFLRDVYDHTVQTMESIDSYKDILSGMMENYLSIVSHRMNEVMKLLTIIATIFIPITFVAGLYGMNFQYMPELEWRWGYFYSLALMAGIAVAMLVYFRKKDWL